jgi:predicted transcriptional regulator YheO
MGMSEIKKEIEELKKMYSQLQNNFLLMQKELVKEAVREAMNEFKKENSGLKNEILRNFRKKRKNIIKKKILEAIKENGIEISDLKYFIVDQLSYCSKASFYRYLEELKRNGLIMITAIDNKNFVLKNITKKV